MPSKKPTMREQLDLLTAENAHLNAYSLAHYNVLACIVRGEKPEASVSYAHDGVDYTVSLFSPGHSSGGFVLTTWGWDGQKRFQVDALENLKPYEIERWNPERGAAIWDLIATRDAYVKANG